MLIEMIPEREGIGDGKGERLCLRLVLSFIEKGGRRRGGREVATFMASELSLTTFGEPHIKRNEMEN